MQVQNGYKRQIAILADAHALLEPVEAILDDIHKRGITEVYSLGDNISVGPNPSEVMDLLEENGVVSIAGNAEEYIRLGIAPYRGYFFYEKLMSQRWTEAHISEHQKELIGIYPHSIDLQLGGKNIALCHFANDIRCDFWENGVLRYVDRARYSDAYSQFYYTNSANQRREIEQILQKEYLGPEYFGYISAFLHPLFGGKMVEAYDAIIQGHTHFKIYEHSENVDFYAIRAAGMAYDRGEEDMASYVILTQTETGFVLEDVLVPFDRDKMIHAVNKSDIPDPVLRRYISYK